MGEAHINGHQADERAIEAQLCAYNTAFAELGLRFRWDARTLASLATIEGEQARIITYIQANHAHLLNAYSAEFLSEAILARKTAHTPDVLPTCTPAVADAYRAQPAFQPASQRSPLASYWNDEPGLPALAAA